MASFVQYRFLCASASALLLSLCLGGNARGDISIELPEVIVAGNGISETTGFFDVVIRADPEDLPALVSAYNVDIVTSSIDLQFGKPVEAPNPIIPGSPLDFSLNVHNVRAAQDLFTGASVLADGAGLVRVPFRVRPGISGTIPFELGLINELASPEATAIPLDVSDTGSITVQFVFDGLPGDYNQNGSVGPEDYDLWRSTFGSTTELAADGNQNGVIDAADFVLWRKNEGLISSGASAALHAAAVPEATTIALLIAATPLIAARCRSIRRPA